METNTARTRGKGGRRDGRSTRSIILEAAGRVFAERGFAEATSKEICERAGANNAAVNYYFGSKDGLYEEVLVEAHRQMLSLEHLEEIVSSGALPEEKLRAFFAGILRTAADKDKLWGVRIFLREIAAPSQAVGRAIEFAVLPKSLKLRQIIAELVGLSPDSPTVQRATAFVVLPCISLLIFPQDLLLRVLPASSVQGPGPARTCQEPERARTCQEPEQARTCQEPEQAPAWDMLEEMLGYALGGLRALADGAWRAK